VPATTERQAAIKAWNYMGGELNWQALPVVADLLGITDVERFLVELVTIRRWNHEQER
jgi:hypothetical protein